MSAALPPLPEARELIWCNPPTPVYTDDQMQAYAQQARADLEAENKRLREALQKYIAWCDAETNNKETDFWDRVEMCREAEAAARAALKEQP